MARFEKIAAPTALLEALHAEAGDDAGRAERAAAAAARSAKRRRGVMTIGGAVMSFFAIPVVVHYTHIPALGGILALLAFVGFFYGAYSLTTSSGLGRGGIDTPDPRRLDIACEVLEAIVPELADTEATLWVLTDNLRKAPVTENRRKEDGTRITVRSLEWFQLEAKAKNGMQWTLRGIIQQRGKTKTRPGKVKTRLTNQERVRIDVAAPAKSPLPGRAAGAVARWVERKLALSEGLTVARGRVRPRRLELELVLDERARNARLADARSGAASPLAAFTARNNVQLRASELLVAAAAVGRLTAAE